MRLTRVLGTRRSVWAVVLVSGLLAGTALGQTYTGLHDGNDVYGIDGTAYTDPWTNSTIISLLGLGETNPTLYSNVSFNAFGISSTPNLINTAAIDVNGVGGIADGNDTTLSAFLQVYGIQGAADVNNSGAITATATGGNVNNIQPFGLAYAYARTFGLYALGNVVNSGDVLVTATAGTAEGGSPVGSFAGVNSDAEAFGIYASAVDNNAEVTVTATGGTALGGGGPTSAEADAYGIYTTGGLTDNAGDIRVTAVGGTADGEMGQADARAYGIYTWGNVVNSGDITVTASAQDVFASEAYGIYMGGEGDVTLTNTGSIRAFGDSAYELYVPFGTVTLIDTYNVTLDGNPDDASIFVDDGGVLVLNNATLTVDDVRGDVTGATQWDTPYRLFGVAAEGMVSGNFAGAEAVNPDVTAIYYTQGTANAADDTVALSYAPEVSETLASASVEKRMVAQAPYAINQHMTRELLYDMLPSDDDAADETTPGLTACQRGSGAFLAPHYSYMEKDNDPLGYQANLSGASGGYTQCVNDSLLGLHFGYSQANIDYTGAGYNANTEDQDIVTSGFSGLTRWKPWIVRYGISGFHGWHDYHGLTGLSLNEQESASYKSYGGTALAMIGHTFRRKAHVFLPEIGASWLWVHRESFTTEATDASWDTTYSAMNDHDVWGEAAVHWQSLYRHKKTQITPSASIGIRQLLTDGETDSWQSIGGAAPVRVEDQQDRTALALATGVVLRGMRTAVTLSYDGEYSSDIEMHNFWMRFKLRF